jgi:hypothetical protein
LAGELRLVPRLKAPPTKCGNARQHGYRIEQTPGRGHMFQEIEGRLGERNFVAATHALGWALCP